MPAWSRILRALCIAYVVATAIHIGWIMLHAPFAFDAWNMASDTKAQPFSMSRFGHYWWFEYTHSNPRIGQAFTYLAYKLEYFAVVATPLAYLLVALAVTILGTGRFPRRNRDFALFAMAVGFIWFAFPQIGKTLFDRAYGANYLYGAAIQLWFLVPLRLTTDGSASGPSWTTTRSPWKLVAYFFAGVAAGLCNEHTGPTLCAFLVGYALWMQRRTRVVPWLTWVGAAGFVAGFAAIFFAPGQGERYDGLVQRVSLLGKLLQRGLVGNLDIVRSAMLAGAPLLALITIVMALGRMADGEARRKRTQAHRLIGLGIGASVTIAVTLFVSPKLGPRFFIFPMAILLAGFIGLADSLLPSRWLVPFVALAVLASGYAALRTVSLYRNVSEASEARLAALEASKRGTVFTADSFEQIEDSWWFLGDDFRDIRKREMIARYFDLRAVVFRGYDPDAALGVSDVRLVPHIEVTPANCIEGGFELGWYRGLDVSTIHKATLAAIEQLRTHLPGRLDRLDLTVQFVGERPSLPRPRLLVARWTPSSFEAYVSRIDREPRHTQRDIVLPKPLARPDVEVFIYQVGGEARRLGTGVDKLSYVPWKTGAYWVLACGKDECFVTAATRQAR